MNVLIIDDHATSAHMLARWLERQDLVVRIELDPANAEASAMRYRPDVIVLDLAMPGRDGLEVLEGLRRMRPWKILVHSGFGAQSMWPVARKRGAMGFVEKGEPYRLLAAIQHAMAINAPPATAREGRAGRVAALV